MKTHRYCVATAGAVLIACVLSPIAAQAQDERVRRGFEAYVQGNWSEAETVFREVCGEYVDAGAPWGWCHMILGVVLGQPGQGADKREEALAQLEIAKELVTTDAERYETISSIANIHLLERNWSGAIDAADEAGPFAASDDQLGVLAKVKGQAYYQRRDYANAAPALSVAVRSRPGEANLHAFLGHAHFELGQKEAAIGELTEALQLDRDNVIGLFFAARINLEGGHYAEAAVLAERAILARPQDTGIRILLGSAYLGADRYDDAIEQFESVVQERADDGTAIYNLGRAYSGTEDWPQAVEQFERAQNLLPPGSNTQSALLYDLGVAFEMVGRYEDALRSYRDSAAIADSVEKQDAIDGVEERIRRAKRKGGGRG